MPTSASQRHLTTFRTKGLWYIKTKKITCIPALNILVYLSLRKLGGQEHNFECLGCQACCWMQDKCVGMHQEQLIILLTAREPNQARTSWKPLLLKTSYKLPHPKTGEEYELPATSYSSNSPRHSSWQMQHQTQELQEPYQFEVSLFPEDFSMLLLESLMHSADRFKEVRSDWLWPYTWASDSILQSCHAVLNSQLSGRLFENELKICWNFL